LGEKENKPLFIIVNKIDLIEDKKAIIFELKNRLKSLSYCPIICLSALKGTGISSLIECLNEILKGARERKTKKKINEKTIKKMIANHPPSSYKGRKLKIHSAQHERGLVNYFTFFVNNPQVVHFSYRRYMINYLRKKFSLKYLPIKLILKEAPQ
jgi:GTP-binding protein